MMRKIIIYIKTFLLCYSIFAQSPQISNNNLPNIFPSSPETSKFNRFGNQNVNLNKGEVSISFPIFNIKNSDISFDLSFSYNSNGVKVSDIATPLGTSWSIDNVPTISRTIRGIPDEVTFFDIPVSFLLNKINNGTPSEKLNYKNAIYNKEYDTEPDIFQYSIIGESGKFYYSQEKGEFVTIPKSNIKIIKTGTIDFKIIDEKGLEYVFGSSGETTQDMINGGISKNAWKVEKITSLQTMNTVNFEYLQTNTYTYKLANTTNIYYVGGAIIPYTMGNINTNPLSNYSISELNIKRIYYNNVQILFNYDTAERLDLKGSKKLNSIEIKTDDTSVKKFVFNHSYKFGPNSIPSNESYTSNRLFLDSFQENNNLNNQNLKTSFEYDNLGLPGRLSYAQDYNGYSNGAVTNTSLTPDVATASEISYDNQTADIFFEGANRKINPNFTQAGLLKKIYYPTGGIKEFEYEQNTIFSPAQIKTQLFESSELIDLSTNPEYPELTSPYEEKIVDIQGSRCFAKIRRNNCFANQTLCGTIKFEGIDTNNQNIIWYPYITDTGFISIPPGRYKLSVTLPTLPPGTQNFEGCWVILNYKSFKNIMAPDQNDIAPGVRIKSIKEYDVSNQFLHKKEYSYMIENSSLSSGYLNVKSTNCFSKLNDYVFYDVSPSPSGICITNYLNTKYYTVYSFDNVDYIDSPKVLYTTITETLKSNNNNNNNGQMFYQFLKGPTATIGLSLPLVPFIYDYQSYEKLQKQITYKTENNLLYKKEEITNNYARQTYDISNGFVFDISKQMIFNFFGGCQPNGPYALERNIHINDFFIYNNYSLKSDKLVTSSVQKSEYLNNNQALVSSKIYEYTTNNLLKSESSTNSNNEILKVNYFYPQDLPSSVLKNLFISKNILSTTLKTQTFKNNEKLSEQETVYASDATTSNLLLPKTVLASKGTQTAETKVTFNSYDDKGNITQYTPEGGIPVVILWGYNKTLPIAKIENATYAQVQPYAANLQTASNNNTLTQNSFSDLRNALPNSMITTYTHKPLVGISTMADAKGTTTTYTYDSFNRLQSVKDHQGNIVNENDYHYKN